jgi:pRiA4b ORF-3-like protein
MRPLFSTPHLYQLRFVLAGISPMIWRRLVISSETSIAQLHEYIQIAFDWSGEHLHSFRIRRTGNLDPWLTQMGEAALADCAEAKRRKGFAVLPWRWRGNGPSPGSAAIADSAATKNAYRRPPNLSFTLHDPPHDSSARCLDPNNSWLCCNAFISVMKAAELA